MNPLTEKVLKSGLIDKATAELMEKFGMLEEGAASKVEENILKNATKEKLEQITEALAEEVERQQTLRETYLDLNRLRWPVKVSVWNGLSKVVDHDIDAVIDREGRYYFRAQDVDEHWFVPGYVIVRKGKKRETILESQKLFIDETAVCLQVQTQED